MLAQGCKSKPDLDNISKGIFDSLFASDAAIWESKGQKLWCLPGDQRLEITMYWKKIKEQL